MHADTQDFHVAPADWQHDGADLKALREAVFIQEQQVPAEEEWDELDADSEHVLAYANDGSVIGCGRLTPEHKIGRMAVLADWRGRGVGAAMLGLLLQRARELGRESVSLHAQVSALEFYRKHGFEAFGEPFMEAGIEHRAMRRQLDPMEPPPAERGKPPPAPASRDLSADTREELRQATLTVLSQARHRICMHTHQLADALADDDELIEELRRIATSGDQASLRFLTHDADSLLRNGHRLVNLAQRLESSISIRVIVEREDLNHPSAFVLNDRGGYLVQTLATMPRARGATCLPGRHASLLDYFNQVWERSEPALALRRLDL